MTVMLAKGADVSITQAAPQLTHALVALGWREQTLRGVEYDLDASALLVGADGKVLSDQHFIFYGNLHSPDGSVVHTGDDRAGGDGDDDNEMIRIDLDAVPPTVRRIVFPVSIYDADKHGQNFGQVRDAYIRVVDQDSNLEVARYDLAEDAATETAMVFGELYRRAEEWKFRAVGQGYATGLRGIAIDFGVDVA